MRQRLRNAVWLIHPSETPLSADYPDRFRILVDSGMVTWTFVAGNLASKRPFEPYWNFGRTGGNDHARPDAGLAAPVPSHHRPRRDPARGTPGRHALGRRTDPHHQLPRDPPPRAQARQAA